MPSNSPRRKPKSRKNSDPPPAGSGEVAPSSPAPLAEDDPLVLGQASETMRLIRSAVRNRWAIPPRIFEAAPAIVGRILLDPATDIRDKIRATQTLAMLDRNNTDLILEANRVERLNDGMSTENVALVASITDEQIAAVAKSIAVAPAAPRKRGRS